MRFNSSLLVLALCIVSSSVVFADNSGEDCPFDGTVSEKDLDKLNSDDFKNKLSDFGRIFLDEIPSPNFFFKLFDTSFKKKTIKRTFFLNCVDWETQMGLQCPIKLCQKMGEDIEKAFNAKKTFSPLDYFKALSGTLENSLKKEGTLKKLSDDEIRSILRTFIQNLSQRLCKEDVKGPGDALTALDGATVDFFRRFNVTDPKQLQYIAQSFGNQFVKAVSNNQHLLGVDLLGAKIIIL